MRESNEVGTGFYERSLRHPLADSISHADDFGGVAADNSVIRHIAGDDSAASEDGMAADGNAIDDGDLRADPDVVSQDYALGGVGLFVNGDIDAVKAVIEADDAGIGADSHAFAAAKFRANGGVGVDRTVVAKQDGTGDVNPGGDKAVPAHLKGVARRSGDGGGSGKESVWSDFDAVKLSKKSLVLGLGVLFLGSTFVGKEPGIKIEALAAKFGFRGNVIHAGSDGNAIGEQAAGFVEAK